MATTAFDGKDEKPEKTEKPEEEKEVLEAEQVEDEPATVDEAMNTPDSMDDDPEVGTNLPAPTDLVDGSGFTGERDDGDFVLHRINLVQKIGDLSEKFDPGSFVLNKEEVLVEYDKKKKATQPLSVIILAADKYYQEHVPWGEPQEPKWFKTKAEVVSAGGGLIKGHPNRYFPALRLLMLVAPPDPSDFNTEVFTELVHDKPYAICTLTLRKSAYYNTAVKLIQLASRRDDAGNPIHLSNHDFALSATVERIGENNIFIPTLTNRGAISEETRAALSEVLLT